MTEKSKDDVRRDDADLKARHPMPGQSGSSGGELARDVGKRDEERLATGDDPEPTRVEKKDKVQPPTATRSDHRGAHR